MLVDPKLNASPTLKSEVHLWNESWEAAAPKLSILVPTFKDDPTPLIERLSNCQASGEIELIIYDDGSGDAELIERIQSAAQTDMPTLLVTNAENNGRAFVRNRLISFARSEWQLLLDADMLPDHETFVSRYIDALIEDDTPRLIVGGFSLNQVKRTKATSLHWAQSKASECLAATVRNQAPGRYVFTSNVLLHRDIMKTTPFDHGFKGWGWEDVEWGLRVEDHYPVQHIDNTATHLGLDTDDRLMAKYTNSDVNFVRLCALHPDMMKTTPLYKMADLFAVLPLAGAISAAAKKIAGSHFGPLPLKVRLLALKVYRAAIYGRALRQCAERELQL